MGKAMKQKWLNKRDIILIIIVLVIGITASILLQKNRQTGQEVVVSVDGIEVNRFPLNQDTEYEIIGYKGEGPNRLIINNPQS